MTLASTPSAGSVDAAYLRRALLSFVHEIGVTTSNSFIEIKRSEQSVRRYLEKTAPRLMLVIDSVPVIIEDIEKQDLDVPFSSKDLNMRPHKIKLTRRVYIERSDFREVGRKDYFRLAPGKTVGLLQMPYPIKTVSFAKDEAKGLIKQIKAVFDKEGGKPKT